MIHVKVIRDDRFMLKSKKTNTYIKILLVLWSERERRGKHKIK